MGSRELAEHGVYRSPDGRDWETGDRTGGEEKTRETASVAEGRERTDAGREPVRIWRSMNDHDSVTVFVPGADAFRQIVEYESAELRALLRGLPEGATVPVAMTRVPGRGNCWKVTDR